MQINEYQHLALRTATTDDSLHPYGMLTNGVMGLCGESGECIDILKKVEFQEHEFDPNRLIDELGDVLWYVAQTATGLGITLEDVAQGNIKKLEKRYPQKFTAEQSIHRPEYERRQS